MQEFFEIITNSYKIWPFASVINFTFVPVEKVSLSQKEIGSMRNIDGRLADRVSKLLWIALEYLPELRRCKSIDDHDMSICIIEAGDLIALLKTASI